MKRLRNHLIGIAQGEVMLFSDFEDGGEMWTGSGARERHQTISFDEPFRRPPSVQAGVSLWDVDTRSAMRADTAVRKITAKGFEIVFRTWGDTRVARLRVNWLAIGEASDDDAWEIK